MAVWKEDVPHIVVGFVSMETAHRALEEAAGLAARLGVRLHVVTALDDPEVELIEAGAERFEVNDFDTAEQAIHTHMQRLGHVPDYSVAVLRAKPADALIAEAKRLGAIMIVVGNVHMQGAGRVLGSVGSKVAHHAPCSVLIAKTT